ncbi:hypothetical protein KFK09_024458 [Dendrobium nobile]|uniref:Uncharacterized protein n=1 Tax=Dendrobium nobile TaxID=94219 RepID=A0A8T3AE47_DENNO|nr:hypothetical protein KFK09_024458 [Dendrobium nobile]
MVLIVSLVQPNRHTIVLMQAPQNRASRTFMDFDSLSQAMDDEQNPFFLTISRETEKDGYRHSERTLSCLTSDPADKEERCRGWRKRPGRAFYLTAKGRKKAYLRCKQPPIFALGSDRTKERRAV